MSSNLTASDNVTTFPRFISIQTSLAFSNYLNENGNLSEKNREEMCLLAYSFRGSLDIVFVDLLILMCSIGTLVLLYLLVMSKQMQKIWSIVGNGLKAIILTGCFCHLIGNINSAMVFGYKVLVVLADLPKCKYIWHGSDCYWFQALYTSFYVRGHFYFHLALFVERILVVVINGKPITSGFLGLILGSGTFLSSFVNTLFTDSKLYENDRVFCFSLYTGIDMSVMSSTILLILADCLITLCELVLFFYNKKRIRKYKRSSKFSLEESFALRELQLSISYIFPYSLMHSLCFFIQMFGYILYTWQISRINVYVGVFLYECVNLSRIGGNMLLLIFLYMYTRFRPTKSNVIFTQPGVDQTDLHFREFKRIIG